MKRLLFTLLITGWISAFCQSADPFPYMNTLETSHAKVKFVSEVFDPLIEECKDLKESDPLGCYDGLYSCYLGTYKVDRTEYKIAFTDGASGDPEFLFYSKKGKLVAQFSGEELYLSKNGVFYIVGIANDLFSKRRKIKIENGKFEEVKQPYYYIGLETKTLKTVKLYNEDFNEEIATLPSGYDVELVLIENDYESFGEVKVLVRTNLGLIGWVKTDVSNYETLDFEGFFFHGD